MPLFDGYSPLRSDAEREWRTNNNLFRSDLEPTGDKWLPDPRLPHRFLYHFGGEWDNYVVIPKGKVVSIVSRESMIRDFPGGQLRPLLTIANGGVDVEEVDQTLVDAGKSGTYIRKANFPVGIADRNVYKNIPDTFYGNEPYFRRYGYIELPHILDPEDAKEMKWGCVVGEVDHTDYVKPNEDGNLVRWDPSKDDPRQIVAQVLYIDHNIPPEGWLQWVMGGDIEGNLPRYVATSRDMRSRAYPREDLLANQGYPYDPRYREWTGYNQGKGIPGLTDGSYVQTQHTESLGLVPSNVQVGDRLFFHLTHTPVVEGTLSVTIGGKPVAVDYIDHQTGLIVIVVPDDDGVPLTGEVVATYKATGQVPGLPSNWNFKGVVGGVRLALKIGG